MNTHKHDGSQPPGDTGSNDLAILVCSIIGLSLGIYGIVWNGILPRLSHQPAYTYIPSFVVFGAFFIASIVGLIVVVRKHRQGRH